MCVHLSPSAVVKAVFRQDLKPKSAQQAPPPQIKSTGGVCVERNYMEMCVAPGKRALQQLECAYECVYVCAGICMHSSNMHASHFRSMHGPHMLQSINTSTEGREKTLKLIPAQKEVIPPKYADG